MTERKTIRQLREERGWSQLDLAMRVGVKDGTVSLWERGLRTPRLRHVLRLADLFGRSVEEIAGVWPDELQHAPRSRPSGPYEPTGPHRR